MPQQADPPPAQPVPQAPQPVQPIPQEPEPAVPDVQPRGFLQNPWVQELMPFVTSVVFHLGLILAGFLTYQELVEYEPVEQKQIIIPDAAIIEGAEVGGIPNPGLGGDPTRAAAQDEYFDADPSSGGWSASPSMTLTSTLMGGGGGEETVSETLIGLGANLSTGKGKGMGTGIGGDSGAGAGDGSGALAPFGVPGGGGGVGPQSPFMGISGNARRVVYLCDASGSMSGVFGSLRAELKKAIRILKPIQAFNIIFFSEGEPQALNKNDLVLATPDYKKRAELFVEREAAAHGSTEPTTAIRMAFAQKPNLIYVLTDGFDAFEGPYSILVEEFRKLNADKSVKVNTILIKNREDKELEDVLRQIAQENGGRMVIVRREHF